MIAVALGLMLTGTGIDSSASCQSPEPLALSQSQDYGPGVDGPSFDFSIAVDGVIQLRSHRWRVPDGTYVGRFTATDWERLRCLLADIQTITPEQGRMARCPHEPDFGVWQSQHRDFPRIFSFCISGLKGSPLEELYGFLSAAVCRAKWDSFEPAQANTVHWLFISPSPPRCGESAASTGGV